MHPCSLKASSENDAAAPFKVIFSGNRRSPAHGEARSGVQKYELISKYETPCVFPRAKSTRGDPLRSSRTVRHPKRFRNGRPESRRRPRFPGPHRPDKRFARPVYGSADTPCPGTSPERHSHATRIRTIFKNTGWRIFRQITISLHFIRRIPKNSLKCSESPEDYHRAIIPYRSILILRRLRAATPAKNKDAFRHPYRNDSLNRPERSVRRRHTCHIGFQPATNAVPRHSPNKLALHSAHNIFH